MKTAGNSSRSGKYGGMAVVALVFGGTALLPALADVGSGNDALTILFLAFFGAIIAIQVIPGLMLFGVMLKGLADILLKRPAPAPREEGE